MGPRPEFPTPEMQAVQRELDARIEVGLAEARDLQDTMDRVAQEEAESEAAAAQAEPRPLPDAAALRTMVTGHALTPQWRAVIDRIDGGTLTWDQVLTGLRTGTADREVTAALQSMATVAPPSPEELTTLGLAPAPGDGPDDPTVSPRTRRQ